MFIVSKYQFFVEKEKEDFVKRKLKEKQLSVEGPEARLSADELSEFYKEFLDKNFVLHANYNRY